MKKNEEINLFLKYLADLYLQNPSLPISFDTIYSELSKFVICDNKRIRLDNDSLIGVQLQLNNKFKNNDNVVTFLSSNGYFWVIQNRLGKSDEEYYSDMNSAIKLYVSVKADNIYKVAELLFNFMISENIVMECKVAKEMRNDALVCCITNEEDLLNIRKYLNKLRYKFNVNANPFLYNYGKMGITINGMLSYNYVISNLIKIYLEKRRFLNLLDNVSSEDFNDFIKNKISLCEITDEYNCNYYNKVIKFTLDNLNDELKLEQLFGKSLLENNCKKTFSKNDEDKILYVINALTNYYSVSDVHEIVMKFIDTGNINLFTKKDGIRTIISNNFSKDDVKNIISELGWKAFIAASRSTYNKYGTEQLFSATQKFLDNGEISGFTRDNNVRSFLGLVIPSELLKEVIESKLSENNLDLTTEVACNFVLEEIEI